MNNNPDYAKAVFGKQDRFTNVTVSTSVKTEPYKDGYARLISNSNSNGGPYLRCNVADSFLHDLENNTPIDITVEYYDVKGGYFSIQYDSNNPDGALYSGNMYIRQTDIVYLEGTETWRTHTFHLEDMKMGGRIDSGNDFRIALYNYGSAGFSKAPIAFRSINVSKSQFIYLTNVSVKSEKLGNIFSEDDEKIKFDIDFYNKSDKTAVSEYNLTVTDKLNGDTLYTKSGKNEIEGRTTKTENFLFDNPGKNSIYSILIEEKTWQAGYENEVKTRTVENEFSVSVKLGISEGDPGFGYMTQVMSLSRGNYEEVPILQSNMGASWNRDGIPWNTVEKEKGVYVMPEGKIEALKAQKEMGISNLIICSKVNPLYDNGTIPYTEEAINAYAKYCGFLAGQLKGIAENFEIFNEYNHKGFNDKYADPNRDLYYVNSLKAAYAEIKKANPNAKVIALGMKDVDLRFAEGVFKLGGLDYCDGISCHPYDWAGGFDENIALKSMLDLKELLKKYGHENDRPVWVTEVGFSVFDGPLPSKPSYPGYTQRSQANANVLMNTLFKAYNVCDRMIEYCMYDVLSEKEEIERRWGILHSWMLDDDGAPRNGAKEGYLAIAAMNKFTGGYNAEYKSIIEDGRFYAINFYNKKLAKNVLVLESGYGEKQMSVNLGCDSVDLYDIFGNKKETICSDNGIYSFVLSDEPYYAIGNFTQFAKDESSPIIVPDAITKTASENDTVKFTFTKNTGKNLNIVCKTESGVSVFQNAGFNGNTAEVILKTDSEKIEKKRVYITITDDNGRIYYSANHNVNICEPISEAIVFEKAVEGKDIHWRALVKVTNNSNTSEVTGKVRISAPDNLASQLPTKKFVDLPPGKTATFLYNMPTQITKKVIKITAEVTLDFGFTAAVSKNMEVTTAAYAEEKPTIDGVISDNEWKSSWFGADEKENFHVLTEQWKNPEDSSFSGTMMWDEDYLYFLAIVTDDVYCINYSPNEIFNMYMGDGMQFGIDDRETVAAGEEATFNEIGIAEVSGSGPVVFRYNTVYGLPDDSIVDGCEASVVRHDTYTLYEMKIPWSGIFYDGYKPKENRVFAFSALFNDNDGYGRRGFMEYGQGLGSGKSVTKFGQLTLLR